MPEVTKSVMMSSSCVVSCLMAALDDPCLDLTLVLILSSKFSITHLDASNWVMGALLGQHVSCFQAKC